MGNIANTVYLSSNAIFESNLDKLLAADDHTVFTIEPGDSLQRNLPGKPFRTLLVYSMDWCVPMFATQYMNIRFTITTTRQAIA